MSYHCSSYLILRGSLLTENVKIFINRKSRIDNQKLEKNAEKIDQDIRELARFFCPSVFSLT